MSAKKSKRTKLTPIPRLSSARTARQTGRPSAEAAAPDVAPEAPDLSHIAAELRPLAVRTGDIEFLAENPLEHSEDEVAEMVERFQRRGQIQPLIVNRRPVPPVVVGGNKRLQAALRLGWQWVAVVNVDLADDDAAALAIELNATQGQAWNKDLLKKAFDRVGKFAVGEKAEAMFAKLAEAQRIMPRLGAGGGSADDGPEPQIDRAEELRKKWGVEPGQLWEIPSNATRGKSHWLLCGDSTKAEDVERVMGGERAGLMNTDPPYGVAYANDDRPNPGVAKPRVANDLFSDADLQAFLEAVFKLAAGTALADNAAWYMWHAHLTQGYFAAAAAAAAAAANVVLHRQIIWVKPVLLLGRGHYHWKHEPCFMGWVEGHQPPDYGRGAGERDQTTIWEVGSVTQAERKEFNHSTPKPVGLFTVPMVKHLKVGEVAYEPFAGSGPQFVAAEKTGRLCRGLEIEPRYVAVCLERTEAMGLEPTKAR